MTKMFFLFIHRLPISRTHLYFLRIQVSSWYCFLSAWRPIFSLSLIIGLLVTCFLSFCFSKKHLLFAFIFLIDTFAGYRNTGWLLFSSCPLYVALLSPGLTLLWQEICCYSYLFPYLPLAGGEQPLSTQWGYLERVFRWVESFIFCITFKFLAVMIIHTLPLNVYWFGLLSCYFSRDESRHKPFFFFHMKSWFLHSGILLT